MRMLETLIQDIRYGARTLRRRGGFTAVSLLALALGIGVNTAVVTAYKAFIARPIDGRDPDTLVNVALRTRSGALKANFSYPDYEAYRDRLRSFSGVVAASLETLRLTEAGGAPVSHGGDGGSLIGRLGLAPAANTIETAGTAIVSENYFAVLGVPPVRGRSFESLTPTELAATAAVLISENYWQRRFGADPAVLGKTVRLNGAAFTIIGITPFNFTGTSIAAPNFWLPLSLYPLVHPGSDRLRDREDLCCRLFGRLRPGVGMREAQAETTVLATQLRALHAPDQDLAKEVTGEITPGSPLPGIVPSLRLTIILIMAAAAMVLVSACANAAGLQLARTATRQQELGMRLSLGASRSRLVRQLVTESAMLGLFAGALALLVTWILLRVAVTRAPAELFAEFTFVLDVTPDASVLAYVLGISVLAGVLFGLVPALASLRSDLFSVSRGSGQSLGRSRLRYGLIAAQVAVSLTLMIAGGLLVRSAGQAINMDTGYDVGRVVSLRPQFPDGVADAGRAALARDLRSRLRALPGVTMIAVARAPNDNGARRAAVSLSGDRPSARDRHATVFYTWIGDNYFETLGIPLVRGRGFRAQNGQPERGVILSVSAAERLWPGQDPIGRHVRLGTDGQDFEKGELLPDGPEWPVLGVARDTRGGMLDRSDAQQIYLPLPEDRLQDYPVLVRTYGDPTLVIRAMEPAIAAVHPGLTVTISTLQAMLRRTQAFLAASLAAAIASSISLFGLLLASMGIYSAVSYDVVLRTREVGIRMAIGAQKRHVLRLMLAGSLRPVVAGLVLGILLAIGASYLLRNILYGISLIDMTTFGAASLLFLTIALAASWLPSRRAMRVDPLVALRDQ